MKGTDFMAVNCLQTTHLGGTVNLINDFFSSVKDMYLGWGNGIISKLFDITGIKFNHLFMAEVFEGSFTTNSLLKKYPINERQVMYIFTVGGDKTYYELKATRVYHDGKIYTERNNNQNRVKEDYFRCCEIPTYENLKEYNQYRQRATRTLVLVASKWTVVALENRKPVSEKDERVLQNLVWNDRCDTYYKIHRVKLVGEEDRMCHITLINGTGKIYKYNKLFRPEHFDKSGYCVVSFRKSLIRRLESRRNYLKLKRVVETDYSQELQTRYDETIVLKNLIATSILNNTDLKTLDKLDRLMGKTLSLIILHGQIISWLEKSSENYEDYKHEPFNFNTRYCYYLTVDEVTKSFEELDQSIMKVRTELFDEVLQQDIA
jgi:hypothetical protein